MPRPLPVETYTQPGEETLVVARRHPRSIVAGVAFGTLVWLGFAIAIPLVFVQALGPGFDPYFVPALFVITVLWLVGLARQWWRMRTSRYVVTPERVYASRGRLFFLVQQTTYDKVTDLHVRQSLFGRWWGYGDVTVQTAGTGLAFTGVPDPLAMKQHVEAARARFLADLIEEYRLEQAVAAPTEPGAAPATESAPAPPAAKERRPEAAVWRGRPVLISALAGMLQGVLMLLFAGSLATWGAADGPSFMWVVAGGLALFGLSAILQGWIHYRYTRYEVHDWGVVVTSGWLTRRRVETTYDKVTDVTTYQGFLGRLLNFGSITVNTAGSNQAPVTFAGLDDPEAVKGVIDETRRSRAPARRRS